MTRDAEDPFESEAGIRRLVRGFETCALPRSEWTHRSHLTVVTWYLCRYAESDATERMIHGIQRYNEAWGSDSYHATITLFWLAIVRRFITASSVGSPLDLVNAVIETYGDRRDLHLDYYSARRIRSWRARQAWIEPDRQPLDA